MLGPGEDGPVLLLQRPRRSQEPLCLSTRQAHSFRHLPGDFLRAEGTFDSAKTLQVAFPGAFTEVVQGPGSVVVPEM